MISIETLQIKLFRIELTASLVFEIDLDFCADDKNQHVLNCRRLC